MATIELSGGRMDGHRFKVPKFPLCWTTPIRKRSPKPLALLSTEEILDGPGYYRISYWATDRWHGTARVYEFRR